VSRISTPAWRLLGLVITPVRELPESKSKPKPKPKPHEPAQPENHRDLLLPARGGKHRGLAYGVCPPDRLPTALWLLRFRVCLLRWRALGAGRDNRACRQPWRSLCACARRRAIGPARVPDP